MGSSGEATESPDPRMRRCAGASVVEFEPSQAEGGHGCSTGCSRRSSSGRSLRLALPPVGGGRGEHPRGGGRDLREQPPVLLRLDLPAAGGPAAGDVPRQVRLLHRARHQGPADGCVLQGRRAAARRPVRRQGRRGRPAAPGCKVLRRGELLGIYPEGTRSPDGRLYRGRTGVARMALEGRVPVLPVAMIGTDKAQPTGKKLPRIMRIGVRIGQAARLLPLRGHGGRPVRPAVDHRRDHVRADAPVRPGVRRHVRHVDEGPHRLAPPRPRPASCRRPPSPGSAATELEDGARRRRGPGPRVDGRGRASTTSVGDARTGPTSDDDGDAPVVAAVLT